MNEHAKVALVLIIHTITYWISVSLAYLIGWRARDRRRPPGGSYGLPLRYRPRGSNPPPPGTKPQFPPGRVLGPDGETIGYRPMPARPGANPPPRKP